MRNGIDWNRPILTWEHFTLNPEGPHNMRAEVGLVSLDGAPFGSVFPDRKLLTTREHAEVLAMSAGAQFLAVPYTRALATPGNAQVARLLTSRLHCARRTAAMLLQS